DERAACLPKIGSRKEEKACMAPRGITVRQQASFTLVVELVHKEAFPPMGTTRSPPSINSLSNLLQPPNILFSALPLYSGARQYPFCLFPWKEVRRWMRYRVNG